MKNISVQSCVYVRTAQNSHISFSLDQPASMPKGRWLTHTTTHSDLKGLAVQLNPVLIQTFTPCVNPDLPCRLYVPQNKANPGGLSHSGNEIWYNAPNVSQLCSTSTELCRLPAEQTGKAGASVELHGLQKHILSLTAITGLLFIKIITRFCLLYTYIYAEHKLCFL